MILRYRLAFKLIPNSSSVLDLGCNDGGFIDELRNRKHCVVAGVEIDPDAVTRAKQKGLDVVQGDLDSIDLANLDRRFDVVTIIDVLEHLRRPDLLLQKVQSISNTLVVHYGNACFWRNRIEILLGKIPRRAPFKMGVHFWYWSVQDFLRFLEENGWKMKEKRVFAKYPLLGLDCREDMFMGLFCWAIAAKMESM